MSCRERVQQGSSYSITSSARASSVGGTSMPSALAVLEVDDQPVLGWLLDRKLGWLEARRSQRIRPSAEPPLTLVR